MTWMAALRDSLRRLFRRDSKSLTPETAPLEQAIRPRTYLYVSDAKVDMLMGGLPPRVRDKFDLKAVVGVPGYASVEVTQRHIDPTRFSRAQRLCQALDEMNLIGDVTDQDSQYFRGTFLAVWGFFSRGGHGAYADVIFFDSVTEDMIIGLGGSAYHSMERAEERLQRWSNSGLQMLMQFLNERSQLGAGQAPVWNPPGAWDYEMMDADHDNMTVPEEIEFVAERLLDVDPDGSCRYILGSPIYVARTGRPVTSDSVARYALIRDNWSQLHHGRGRLDPAGELRPVGKYDPCIVAPIEDPRGIPLEQSIEVSDTDA